METDNTKFQLGDRVRIKDYGDQEFEVQRIITDYLILNDHLYKKVIYSARHLITNDIINVLEDKMTLITTSLENVSRKTRKMRKGNKKLSSQDIDDFLDIYNDYMSIHHVFKSLGNKEVAKEYKKQADYIIALLKTN